MELVHRQELLQDEMHGPHHRGERAGARLHWREHGPRWSQRGQEGLGVGLGGFVVVGVGGFVGVDSDCIVGCQVWTSGRLCDKEVDGCDQPRFQPYNINGWFWAATLGTMGPTNNFSGRKFNAWSGSGPTGRAQPDGILKQDGFGEQACLAILDNFFNDGLSWHDTKCNDRRHIVCEDLPVGNINFVRQQNPGVIIPN